MSREIELLSIRKIAKKYGLSEAMLRQMEERGELPGIYTGAKQTVKKVDVDALFEVLKEKSRRCGR